MREILISESAWEEMTCLFAPSLMEAMDAINDRYGKRKVVIGAQGFQNKHEAKADMRSPRFTTRLSDLPVIC
nr:DUF4113 domain-containing protein [Klebsiella pneumoniae]